MSDRPTTSRPRAVPSGRLTRFAHLGSLATSIAGTAMIDGARQLSRGTRPDLRGLILTPANITRLADQLARMRGAAMKVGQLLSMDAGELLPPELAQILARLRAEADHMPPRQLRTVLTAEWGADWQRRFRRFDVRPIAAASIGQVHRAETQDGRTLALKVQYPGIRRSIDSDVDNVAALIRLSGLVPPGMDIAPLLAEAKRQLHEEADYLREAAELTRFRTLLADMEGVTLPGPQPDLTTKNILAMTFLEGHPIEHVADAPQAERDRIGTLLARLALRELFEFRRMQTDPNFANYRYAPDTGKLILLDFGASRAFPDTLASEAQTLLRAGLAQDRPAMHAAALALGAIGPAMPEAKQAAVLDMIDMAFEALRTETFDFAASDLAARLRDAGMALGADREVTHVPPVDALYLNRKLAGTYLLLARIGARVSLPPLVQKYL